MDKKSSQSSGSLIVRSGLKMSVATFLSRILGLVREQAMAAVFGASSLTDAFLVAYRIPNLLRDLLAEGAFSSAFVPIFTEMKQKGDQEARNLLWSVAILLGIVTSIIGIFIYASADPIIRLFAPAFVSDPKKLEITINLTKWMAPYLLCVSLAALFTGVLNVFKIFFVPSLAPAAFNIVMIGLCFGLTPILVSFGYEGIYSLAIAVFIGGILQAVLQYPLLKQIKYTAIRPVPLLSPTAIRVVKRLGPGLIGFAATQLNLLVTTILASSVVGAVSWLNYAFRLLQFPVGIFGVAIANSHLVHFSDAVKKGDTVKAQELLQISYIFSLFLLLPATALLFGLSDQMVHIIFERGRFHHSDTQITSLLLSCYALGLPFLGLYKILVPSFYALDKQNIPIFLTLVSLGMNILFCWFLTPIYGVKILAIGTSLTMGINGIGCIFMITPILKLPKTFFINKRVLKLMTSAILSVATCYLFTHWGRLTGGTEAETLPAWAGRPLLMDIIFFLLASVSAGVVYLGGVMILGEGHFIRGLLRRH